jgi:ribosomal protein L24
MDKIRKNDEVIVLAGKDKGKRGVVQKRVDAEHVIVEGVNVAKKATKPNPMTGVTGGIAIRLCRFTCRTSRCSTRRPARQIALASKTRTAKKSASSSPAAK